MKHKLHIKAKPEELATLDAKKMVHEKNPNGVPQFENNKPKLIECLKVNKDGTVLANDVGLVMVRRWSAHYPGVVIQTEAEKKAAEKVAKGGN